MGPEVREERRVITAVFADLVGSTALAERLDPEEARLIIGEALGRMVRLVEELGGTVKDLAGDGVLALFGAPVSHEDDPERAVRFGLRAVEEMEAYGEEVERAWGIGRLAVRVGIATGPVVVGPVGAGDRVEYGAYGDPVNIAARLQVETPSGGVLVDGATRSLVGPRFDWGEARLLHLRGKDDPVEASQVLSVRPDAERTGRRVNTSPTVFVGRRRELGVVGEALEAVGSGSGRVLFVAGEAGIGKSRLVEELRSLIGRTTPAPAWVEGHAASYAESIPYWPFRELVRDWLELGTEEPELRVRIALRSRVEQLFGDRAPELYPYLGAMLDVGLEPEAAARLGELSPEALQYRTFEVVEAWLARLARDAPLVAVLEDLHWADPTSLQLAERLVGVTEQAAVLLVITARPDPGHASWRVREAVSREFPHRLRELTLAPLSGDADRELLHGLVGPDTLPDDLQERILTVAEGNPFFLEELVRSLVDAGAIVQSGEGWSFDHRVPIEVPPTVRRVILARVDRLPPASRRVVTAGAVLGRQFSLPLLEAAIGDLSSLADSLHELQRLDLLREARRWPQPEYRFKHALIQEAVYLTVVRAERRDLHGRAALWLEDHYAGREEEVVGLLAHHWLAAEDPEKAILYLTRAGDQARQEYALDEAIDAYRSLLRLLEAEGRGQEMALVLFKLALALHTALRFEEADAAYRRAFDLWRPPEPLAEVGPTLRVASGFLPDDRDPTRSHVIGNIQYCMAIFDRLVETWPERTVVPSLAERWEISEDGLRYVFHLRRGPTWSDGVPITAQDVEYGVKRALDPDHPGASVAIFFVLEEAREYFLGEHRDPARIGVRALDDQTVEFRLVAPAPYFMSMLNRPDAGPQPRHAIERDGLRWTESGRQVVSGPFREVERTADLVVLERRAGYGGTRTGNVARVELARMTPEQAVEPYLRGELDLVNTRFHPAPGLSDSAPEDLRLGPPAWLSYLALDHRDPLVSSLDFRKALAHAIDREALSTVCPHNYTVATGGVVPPPLQGHTPEIVPSFDPDVAREHLSRLPVEEPVPVTTYGSDIGDPEPRLALAITSMWEEVLGLRVEVRFLSSEEVRSLDGSRELGPIFSSGWFPGYPDPEYYLRLLLHSDASDNLGRFSDGDFDTLIEQARQERSHRRRLELYHRADRRAVSERIAMIPVAYGRNITFVKPWIHGWWEFGKAWSSFADLVVDGRPSGS